MANVFVNDETLLDIAEAIREKTGDTKSYKPGEMPAAIRSIESAGDKAIIERTVTSISRDDVEQIGDYALSYCKQLIEINFPNAAYIGYSGCMKCEQLTSVNLPMAQTIGGMCFYNCSTLTSANLPMAQTIGDSCFYKCSTLTEISLPEATSLSSSAFSNCSTLASVYIPKVETIGNSCFHNCSALTTLDLPSVTTIVNSPFAYTALETLILRSETMVSATGAAVAYTPIKEGTGYIYVPSALVNTYKADSKWSTYADQFRAIEDYPDICG